MDKKNASRIPRLFLASLAMTAAPAHAQAWLPPKGEATLTLAYQYQHTPWHTDSAGQRVDFGLMEWQQAVVDVGYSIADRLAVRVAMPYVFSKYTGTTPHVLNGRVTPADDGSLHGTFQDLRFEARFMATTGSLVVTPFVGAGLPITSYETFGHASPGRGLWEVAAGVNVGRRLDPVLPEGYVQGRYAFAIPERVLGVWHNRSNATLELGYFVTSALTLRAFGAGQVTHGGFRLPQDVRKTPDNFLHHDQLMRESYFGLGGGVSYAVTGSTDVFVSGFKQLSGSNGVLGSTVSVGIAWNFSPARLLRQGKSPRPDPDQP